MVMPDMLEQFAPALEAMVLAQEAVISRNSSALLKALVTIKSAVDAQVQVFHKISVNRTVESMYCDPVQWAKTVAKHGSPWKHGVPGMSGLTSPMFHALDVFLGRNDYSSVLGVEALHLRDWMPPIHKRFLNALGEISVGEYCKASESPELRGLFRGILESYAGERGFLGTHRYKVYGFLELAFKTGRTETNGDTMGANERGWEAVHDSLAAG
jgi:sulfite reductase (NADPH) flavoprotein alpha-component